MNDFERNKDRLLGKLKETAGKVTDNQELEFKGKLQGMKSEVGEKFLDVKEDLIEKIRDIKEDATEKMDDVKEDVLEKANDLMDRMKKK